MEIELRILPPTLTVIIIPHPNRDYYSPSPSGRGLGGGAMT